jgi:hypothetical protein
VVLMMRKLIALFQSRVAQVVALSTVAFTAVAVPASAAASATTGVDYVSDLVGPVKSELTLAIVAGLGILVVLMAVKAGVRLVRSFGR